MSGRIKNDPVDLELITLARNLAFPSRLRRESEPLPPLPSTPDLPYGQGRYKEVFLAHQTILGIILRKTKKSKNIIFQENFLFVFHFHLFLESSV